MYPVTKSVLIQSQNRVNLKIDKSLVSKVSVRSVQFATLRFLGAPKLPENPGSSNLCTPGQIDLKAKIGFQNSLAQIEFTEGAHPVNLARRQLVVLLEGLAAQGGNNTMNVDCITCVVFIAEDDHHKRRHQSVSCFRRTRPSRARV